MFLFRPGRKTLFYSLLFSISLFLTGCKNDSPGVSNDPTQLTVITLKGIPRAVQDSLEVKLGNVKLPGTTEPFFSSVTYPAYDRGNLPKNSDILFLVSTAGARSDSSFGRVFSTDLLSRVAGDDEALFLKKEDLYRKGQTVWFVLYHSDTGLQKFITSRFDAAAATIMSTCIRRIMSADQSRSRYEKELSVDIQDKWGIGLRLPEGFEKNDSISSSHSLFRRGAGTKTEEWILIGAVSGSPEMKPDELRDRATRETIRYQDGSTMRTVSSFEYLGKPGFFRGNWETTPYPMAGVFTARLLDKGGKMIYIEAGIYSPGRNKTLNLLRLEKLLRDL